MKFIGKKDMDAITSLDGRTLQDLLDLIQKDNPQADIALVERAFEYAKTAHGTQRRKSGELYIVHPLSVAFILAELGLDEKTIAAGILHDVPEDTERTLHDVKKAFGKEIAFMVEGITKLGQLKYRGMDRYVENLRRMFVAMAKDVRVVLIKFADRIHNLQTLEALPPEKRRRIALESLEIYAPIANRLGMGEMKGLLEDLSFPYVYPEEYQWMQKHVLPQFKVKEAFIDDLSKFIKKKFAKRNVELISIHGRTKHVYSLYQKLLQHHRDIQKIYDLVALRIIVADIGKCYESLGVIHEICKPLKGRIKDYIAQPKPNQYRSLHTTVFSPIELSKFQNDGIHGEIVEIQIRTPEMHAEAEYGIAAHWKYKDSSSSSSYKPNDKRRVAWVQQIVDIQKDFTDEKQFLETVKLDFLQNYIFVFTPRGDVIELPENATPVDFAYRIHTDVGNKCSGVKINDQISSLDEPLKSGDVVEIFTDSHRKGPSPDWLQFVKTNTAQNHIRAHVNKKKRSLFEGFKL